MDSVGIVNYEINKDFCGFDIFIFSVSFVLLFPLEKYYLGESSDEPRANGDGDGVCPI